MATQTSATVSTILQIMSDLRGETSVNSDAVRIRAVSRTERDFATRFFWRTHLLRDQTTTGDGANVSFAVGSTTFPMRMKGLTEVFVGGTTEDKRHQIVDYNVFKEIYNNNNAAKIAHEWYDAANDVWKMKINPMPSNGEVITYSYYWEPPTRTATSDVVVCPNMKIIAFGALAEIYDSEDETDTAEIYRRDQEQLINELIGREDAPAVNQLYVMGAVENSPRNRGIGTY